MNTGQLICSSIHAKVLEQIERTEHLIGLLPESAANSTPPRLLGHLLDCLAGFCAALYAAKPAALMHFAQLREIPVNTACSAADALARIPTYRAAIGDGFALLGDSDLTTRVPTVFVPEGELLVTLLLGNLEHLINHKHQLFMSLKLAGLEVGTPDLYHFRGNPL